MFTKTQLILETQYLDQGRSKRQKDKENKRGKDEAGGVTISHNTTTLLIFKHKRM